LGEKIVLASTQTYLNEVIANLKEKIDNTSRTYERQLRGSNLMKVKARRDRTILHSQDYTPFLVEQKASFFLHLQEERKRHNHAPNR
jgi:hypothetical protein